MYTKPENNNMGKFGSYLLVMALILTGCAGSGHSFKQTVHEHGLTLRQCKEQLPAANPVSQYLVGKALAEMGADSLSKLISQTDNNVSGDAGRARYAIQSLTQYAKRPENAPAMRKWVSETLIDGFRTLKGTEAKRFILDQMNGLLTPDAIAFLRHLLDEPDFSTQAVQALAGLKTDDAAKTLFHALKNETVSDQAEAVQALGILRYHDAVSWLSQIAADSGNNLQQHALSALIRMGESGSEPLIEALPDIKRRHILLIELATTYQGTGGYEEAAAIFQNLYSDPTAESHIRVSALNGLVSKENQSSLNRLIHAFADPEREVRATAFLHATVFTLPGATQQFAEQLDDLPTAYRIELLDMLGKRGDPLALDIIKKSLDDTDETVRVAALDAIWHLSTESYLGVIKSVLNTEFSDQTGQKVSDHFQRIKEADLVTFINSNYDQLPVSGKSFVLQTSARRQLPGLKLVYLNTLSGSNASLQMQAAEAIAPIAADDDLGTLLSAAEVQASQGARRIIWKTVAELVERSPAQRSLLAQIDTLYHSAPDSMKEEIISVYRRIGGKQALRFVLNEVEKGKGLLHEVAVRNLSRWPDDSAVRPLLDYIETTSDLNEQVLSVRGLIRLLRDPEIPDIRAVYYLQKLAQCDLRPEERRLVIGTLAQRPLPSAFDLAIGYLKDPEVSGAAYTAVVEIAAKADKSTMSGKQMAGILINGFAGESLQETVKKITTVDDANEIKPPQGFDVLFNGRDLSGWQGLVSNPPGRAKMSAEALREAREAADRKMREHWHVIDGILFFDGYGESLCTIKNYRNYELLIDWKIEKDGDSGIYLRGTPQVQMWDPAYHPEGSGGLFNNQKHPSKPLVLADNPAGEWNRFRIIVRGERVTVYLNEVLVVDNIPLENYWERDKPLYPSEAIELQAHFSPLYFKNIFIRELPDEDADYTGFLFNGKDLTGWQVVGGDKQNWYAEEDILFTSGEGGGWIATEKEYADFELSLEFRLPEGGNSGVFLRAPLTGNPAYAGMEFQVLDDYADVYKDLKPWQYTASLYGLQPPSSRQTKQAGEWQKMEITCKGPSIIVKLNGVLVNDVNLVDYMGHVDSHPGIKRRKGVIGLQNHSTKVEYRNIYINEL